MILDLSESQDAILIHILFLNYYLIYLFFDRPIFLKYQNIGMVFLPTVKLKTDKAGYPILPSIKKIDGKGLLYKKQLINKLITNICSA